MRFLVSSLLAILVILGLLSALVILLEGCSDSQLDITGPTGPPVQAPGDFDGGPTEPPLPFNPGPVIDLDRAMIFSSFALNSRDEQTQRRHLRSARNRGYDTARMCVELEGWNKLSAFRARGPYTFGAEALQKYEDTLKVIADEGMSALVMAICSELRKSGSNEKREAWVRAVGKRSREYDNVAFEAANEWEHPNSVFRDDRVHIRKLINILRSSSGGAPTGTDQGIGARFTNTSRYAYDRSLGSDFFSFHPWRNPDPTRSDIRDIVNVNNGQAILSETTSWGDEFDKAIFGWLVTTDKEQIQTYMENCLAVPGCVWTFHSIEGLFADGAFTWMPRR